MADEGRRRSGRHRAPRRRAAAAGSTAYEGGGAALLAAGSAAQCRRTLAWRRNAVVAGLTAGAVFTAAAGATVATAETTPQRVLQAVQVELGTDGAIAAIRTTSVHGRDGSDDTTTRAVDPAEHAGELPVRVTTSWAHDGRVGTDLSELRGVTGLVELHVTVENTTVHPEQFTYDAAGASRQTYALVGTPLTVVASATLPEGTFGQVRQPVPGTTGPGTTNGVVSGAPDGSATVQWASLLAPPRLATSTTFTLVLDAQDFQVPDLHLSVQPGISTDTSVARLVGDAFGSPSALIGSENGTIGLIAGINATLSQAADSLQTVRETLAVNAGEVGAAATASLTSTAASLDASSAAVLRDLQALDTSVGQALDTTRTRSLSSLQASVQGVLAYFGTPAAATPVGPPVPPAPGAACGTVPPVAGGAPAPTLLGQLGQVSAQLRALSSASALCVGVLRDALTSSIGDEAACDPASAPGRTRTDADVPLVCRLQGTGQELAGLAADLQAQGAAVDGVLHTDAVSDVDARIADLQRYAVALQRAGDQLDLTTGRSPLAALLSLLDDLDDQAQDALDASTATSTAGVATELRGLAATARARLADLQGSGSGTDGSVRAQLEHLADLACALPGVPAGPTSEAPDAPGGTTAARDVLHGLVAGGACKGQPKTGTLDAAFPVPLVDRLDEQVRAWQHVLDTTDVDAKHPQGAAAELLDLRDALTGVRERVQDVRAAVQQAHDLALPGGHGKGTAVRDSVAALLTQLDGLYDASAQPGTCDRPAQAGRAPLNRLAADFREISCTRTTVAGDLRGLLDSAAQDVSQQGTGALADAAAVAGSVRDAGAAQLDALSGTLADELGSVAAQQQAQGAAVVAEQQARLAAVQAAAQRDLDAAAQAAIGQLAAEIGRADASQAAAARALQDQLQAVLVDLGSASGGRGLLGVIQNSAGQTGVRVDQVQQASATAASFRSVRLAELADAQLEQQQLTRSLQSAQLFPAFAEDLPAGSTHTTVFTLHLRPEA